MDFLKKEMEELEKVLTTLRTNREFDSYSRVLDSYRELKTMTMMIPKSS